MKPNIHVLALGGTIAAVTKPQTDYYDAATVAIKDLLAMLPANASVSIHFEQLLQQISHEMSYADLFLLAQRINVLAARDDVAGIVVTQGTNCLEEAAYFISLIVNTKKPIVFTGAFRPSNALGFDGLRNLQNAILIAASPKAQGIGVVITFNDSITAARDASKINPSFMGDFSGTGQGLIGYVQGTTIHINRLPQHRHTFASEFNTLVLNQMPATYIIYGHLGMDEMLVKTAITNRVAGIISAGMGEGYQPRAVTRELANAVAQGICVVRCSRTGYGLIEREAEIDDKYGFIAGGSLNPQKAKILLSVALCNTADKNEIQRIFTEY